MKEGKFLKLILILISIVYFSCKKPNNQPEEQPGKNLHERIGDFKATVFVSYTTAAGGSNNDQQATVSVKRGGEQLPLLLQQTAQEILQDLHR